MKKYILLTMICLLAVLSISCDLGMVKLMDKEEYGKETGMGVRDVGLTISSENDTYYGTNNIKVRIDFDESFYLYYDEIYDLRVAIKNNLEVVNAKVNNVESYREYDTLSSLYKMYFDISITPDGYGNIEVTLPEKSVYLPYNEDQYLNCYNVESSDTLVIKPDLLYPYSLQGLNIAGVCSISTHEYLVVDSNRNKILYIDSDTKSVIKECSSSISSLGDMIYSSDENKLYLLDSKSTNLSVLDVSSWSLSTKSFASSSNYGYRLQLDENGRRIYILSSKDKLYSLDMDDYSVKINEFSLPSSIHCIALDATNHLLYAAKSFSTYKYNVAGDSVVLINSHSSTSYHVGFSINSDGSEIYFSNSSSLQILHTSDLSESSFGISKNLHSVFANHDFLVTLNDSYSDRTIYKYRISDRTLINFKSVGYTDGFGVNSDGTEVLVYHDEYLYSGGSGVWADIIYFTDL